MTSVFASFIFGGTVTIASIGFSHAFGVLGDRAWRLPRWIDRILPDVDIEGKHLQDQLLGESAAEPTAA
ncbi:MAG: hypothetical protein WAL22_17320 [Solirubrobacteraceae bacterium]